MFTNDTNWVPEHLKQSKVECPVLGEQGITPPRKVDILVRQQIRNKLHWTTWHTYKCIYIHILKIITIKKCCFYLYDLVHVDLLSFLLVYDSPCCCTGVTLNPAWRKISNKLLCTARANCGTPTASETASTIIRLSCNPSCREFVDLETVQQDLSQQNTVLFEKW